MLITFTLRGMHEVWHRYSSFTARLSDTLIECFFEDLHRDDKMTVTFLVGPGVDGGGHEVSFWVNSDILSQLTDEINTPSDAQLVQESRMENGDFSFTATEDGTYRYCFSNVACFTEP